MVTNASTKPIPKNCLLSNPQNILKRAGDYGLFFKCPKPKCEKRMGGVCDSDLCSGLLYGGFGFLTDKLKTDVENKFQKRPEGFFENRIRSHNGNCASFTAETGVNSGLL